MQCHARVKKKPKNPVTCRWSLRVCRLEHAGHHVVLRLAVGEGGELTRMLPSWLRSSVV